MTLAVLSALGALHRAGRVHGGVSEDAVGVAADGWVRLATGAAGAARHGAAGDLRDTGALLCRLLGAPLEEGVAPPSGGAERTAPALVALGRSLASRRGSWSADEAWTAVREAAGFWGSEPELVRALADLAARAGGGPLEQAVARIVVGPPLRAEPPPPAAQASALHGPDLRRLFPLRPSLPALPSLPSLPEVRVPRVARPDRRFLMLMALVLLSGLVAGGAAGLREAVQPSRTAAAARAAKPAHSTSQPAVQARPAGLYAQTPSAAVAMFFQLVQQQRLDQAALLWKPSMSAQADLRSRFTGVAAIDLRRDDTVAEDDRLGIATVVVDWVETDADGTTHEYAGEIFTDTGPVLWRWDSWRVQEVSPSPSGNGGDSEGG